MIYAIERRDPLRRIRRLIASCAPKTEDAADIDGREAYGYAPFYHAAQRFVYGEDDIEPGRQIIKRRNARWILAPDRDARRTLAPDLGAYGDIQAYALEIARLLLENGADPYLCDGWTRPYKGGDDYKDWTIRREYFKKWVKDYTQPAEAAEAAASADDESFMR